MVCRVLAGSQTASAGSTLLLSGSDGVRWGASLHNVLEF